MLRYLLILLTLLSIHTFLGCAEGPLWRSGKYNPWVRTRWSEEEKIADTLFARKRRMENVVAQASNGPIDVQEDAARALSDIIFQDKVVLMRLHAVQLLGNLDCPTAIETLTRASRDNEKDIRLAAVRSWKMHDGSVAVPQLQELIGSDTDIDVRLAATEALGSFPGRASVEALSLALNDRDPALQVRATESLGLVAGESLGRDVVAWQEYVRNVAPSPAGIPGTLSQSERLAQQPDGSSTR